MTATQLTVIDLDRLDAGQIPLVGGKAANLGELINAGFTVPGGFCVATPAYAQAATAAGLDDVLDGSHAATPGAVTLGEAARAALLSTPVPDDVAAAVAEAYAELGENVPVAVRSSATAEDLPSASFAGQQDTYLNIVGVDALLDAVRRCWASLWTDRAVSYRASNGIDHHAVQLAVVVQRMVESQVAGVLFTADPVSGRRTRTVIDASPGLGEAVVSGAVNPDHVIVEGDGTIAEHRIGDKAVVIRGVAGGGTEHVTGVDAGKPSLSDAQIAELVALGRRVEAHYGTPQDIEWAIDADGTLWLTQSRPITTLYPLPEPSTDELRVYFCFSLAQGLTRPFTPMGTSAARVIGSGVSTIVFGFPVVEPRTGPKAFREAGGRLFVDITPALRSSVGRTVVPKILEVMEARSAVVLRSLFDEPRLSVTSTSRAPLFRGIARVMRRYRIPQLAALALGNPAAARRRVDQRGAQLRRVATRIGPHATGQQRLDHVESVLVQAFTVMPKVVPVAAAGYAMLALARKLAGPDLDDATRDEVVRSLPHNSTTEMDLELWALATRIRGDADSAAAMLDTSAGELASRYRRSELPPVLQYGLAGFLHAHGHRAVAEIDVGMPRWSDDPSHVLGVLANYLRLTDPELAPDRQFARGARAAEAAVAGVVARVRRRSWARGAMVAFALGRVRELLGMRETHKDYLVWLLAHVRSQLQQIGAELAERGLLDDAEDVFFLDLFEARSALAGADHRATVVERCETYERELRRRRVPRVLLSDGTEPEALATSGDAEGALTGTPASAGSVTAKARVVLDPVGAHLEPGEILVCPSTDPGWTPLFLTAGGLVMEMGGPNSHGAVVAREYGIPAVVGVADATHRIATGETITVDGAAGLVRASDS